MSRFFMNLRLFDGEGAAPAAGGQSVTGAAPGNNAQANAADGSNPVDAAPEGTRPSFKDLIKGDYKAEADEYIQNIVRSRVRDSKADKATISSQNEILNIVAAKYGLDTNDLSKLKEAVSNDDDYYAERAMQEGLTVEQYKRIAKAESNSRMYEERARQAEAESFRAQMMAQWNDEAAATKSLYPEFNFEAELNNKKFADLLGLGFSVQNAYESLHLSEIMDNAVRNTASDVRQATVNNIASRSSRPRENVSSSQAASSAEIDVHALTRQDREEMSRRALSGETINPAAFRRNK